MAADFKQAARQYTKMLTGVEKEVVSQDASSFTTTDANGATVYIKVERRL